MPREFRYRVYILGYEREGEGGVREEKREVGKREATATSSEEGWGEKELRLEEAEDPLIPAKGEVGGAFLLREQGNQLTEQIITVINSESPIMHGYYIQKKIKSFPLGVI